MRMKSVSLATAAALAAALATVPAHANLVQLAGVQLTGQGIGAVLTVLTLQTGPETTESGGVNFNGTTFGDASTGASQSHTFTFADLGITKANQFGFVVNLAEPGSENPPSVTATSTGSVTGTSGALTSRVTLNVFSAAGLLLETHSLAGDSMLNQIAGGVGGSGLVFGLNAGEAATLQATFLANPGLVLTAGATFANAQGGNDVIQAVRLTQTPAIPEPGTYALMLAGLGVVGFVARRRQQRQLTD